MSRENYRKEAIIILATEAIRRSKMLSHRTAAKLYDVLESMLRSRINDHLTLYDRGPAAHKLCKLEEEVMIIRYEELHARIERGKARWQALGASIRPTPARAKDAF